MDLGWVLNPKTGVLTKKRKEYRHANEEGHVKMEAEIKVIVS